MRIGLECALTGPDVPMIRHNDPSRNRMMCFSKGPVLSHQKCEWLKIYLKIPQNRRIRY